MTAVRDTTRPAPDRGAISGPLAALSFVSGIGAANVLADLPYPRPGTAPSPVSRYFTQNGELSRPVAFTALDSAATCLLAPLYLVAEPFAWFIPAGRFPGLLISGIVGARLASDRRRTG